jgi:hypothetical protein
VSQERQRFPIQPQAVRAGARSSNRIHSEAGELGRDRAKQRQTRTRRKKKTPPEKG